MVTARKKPTPRVAPRPVKKAPSPASPRAAVKKTVTPAAKPASAPVNLAPLAKAFAQVGTEKPSKVKKPKLVRDSFTIPKAEYTVLDDLKQRAAKLTRPVKKSELIRAGIKALAAMPDAAFLAAMGAVPAIKTGRPLTSPGK
jgi:hypothetical protein